MSSERSSDLTLRDVPMVAAVGAIIGCYAAAVFVAFLSVPVLAFQALLWLRGGEWVTITPQSLLSLRAADTGWIGINTIVDRLAGADLAVAIMGVAGGLYCLAVVASGIGLMVDSATRRPDQ